MELTKTSKSLLLLVSHSCNLKCKYCYEWHKDSRLLTWDDAERILRDEFGQDEEIESIDLLGGEPLLNFHLIQKIANWVWQKNPHMKISTRTNGTLLTASMKNWFAENKHRFTLGISFDGTPETNLINRGTSNVDLDFFVKNWPNNPIKITIFPETVKYLSESLLQFYEQGYSIIGGLAQGVKWDFEHCFELGRQLEILADFYKNNPNITPLEPLLDLKFELAFSELPDGAFDLPCWERANISAYDCDGELLPCHMFSVIVQGPEKRKTILEEAKNIVAERLPSQCLRCPIRWSCKNCMGINYQHTGSFDNNVNLSFMCEAQKIAAQFSAELVVDMVENNSLLLNEPIWRERAKNAVRYLKSQL